MELDIENKTDTILYVTTKDFKIKNKETGAYLSEKDRDSIFPPDLKTGYYIDFVALLPFISEDLLGEKIHLTCPFSISSVKTNSMYNTTSCCSYGYTPDTSKIQDVLSQKKKEWKEQGLKEEEIEFQGKNWLLLDAQRITVSDSFDFIVETVGVFTNELLVEKACDILVDSLKDLQQLNDTNELQIKPSNSTLQNSLDIILVNEDYTIGKIIEYVFYSEYFSKTVDYVGFKKVHPYDTFSTLRVAYKEKTEISLLRQDLNDCIRQCIVIFQKIKQIFNKK
jgi:DNA-directed RNA polymerase subunit L